MRVADTSKSTQLLPHSGVESSDGALYSGDEMSGKHSGAHAHTAVTTHVLRQRSGVPYEVERVVCLQCRRVLRERALRRAAA